ncbi:MAG: right-handed parallel beta-helix repeat-containing protein [Planctomycetota bacterium]|jgi:hypothetical protein
MMSSYGPKSRLTLFLCLTLTTSALAQSIYVDTDANGLADGSNWQNAFNHLQDALAAASIDDQIFIARGTYTPDRDKDNPNGTKDPEAMFELKTDVTIKGGFAGSSEPNPDARDIVLYETILSGDLNADDEPNFVNYDENTYHIINASGTSSTAILDGVTITAANANGSMNSDGGGIINYNGSPILINCNFKKNRALWYGGAMYNDMFSKPTIINCNFTNNKAQYGGAVESRYYSDTTFINCSFIANTAEHGGGIANAAADATVINCLFSANHANHRGGAIHDRFECESLLSNCIIWDNNAVDGPQINLRFDCQMYIDHCDLQGGTSQIYLEESTVVPGPGNIDADPCFVLPGFRDVNGLWTHGDYSLLPNSPCIDSADNTIIPEDEYDLAGNPRFNDGDNDGNSVVDMGPLEFFWPPLQVDMKLTPQSLNPTSQGNWVKAHFVMPPTITEEDIDINTPFFVTPLDIDSTYMNVFLNSDGLVTIEAGFNRNNFANVLAPFTSSESSCDIKGMLLSGQPFYGTTSFKITGKIFNHLAVLSSWWLNTDCTEPDFCGGFDFNRDGIVNFIDLTLLNGQCADFIGK